ncbi:MAG: hypothetical protein R3E48_04535 [Burkholderiaceae bacterium]
MAGLVGALSKGDVAGAAGATPDRDSAGRVDAWAATRATMATSIVATLAPFVAPADEALVGVAFVGEAFVGGATRIGAAMVPGGGASDGGLATAAIGPGVGA